MLLKEPPREKVVGKPLSKVAFNYCRTAHLHLLALQRPPFPSGSQARCRQQAAQTEQLRGRCVALEESLAVQSEAGPNIKKYRAGRLVWPP